MKLLRLILPAIAIFTCIQIQAAPSENPPIGFRLIVDLRDGSRVIGKSADDRFQFHSDILGDVKLPLEKIRSLECSAKTNVIQLTTANGDLLAVEFAMNSLKVETVYGKINLPISLIKDVRVSVLRKFGRPTEGLIGMWRGDGNADDSIGGNDGVLQNVGFTDGVVGQAFSFNPDRSPFHGYTGVRIEDRLAYELTHSLTIEGWIRPRGTCYSIFFRGDHRPGLDPYSLGIDGHNNLGFNICSQDGNTASVYTMIGLGMWIHVAAVLDGDTGKLSLYTNGVLAAQTTTDIRPAGRLLADQSPGVSIGNVNDGGNNFPFTGDIDEIGLYNRALSADEVNAIYNENVANAGDRVELFRASNQNQNFRYHPNFISN